MSIYQNRTEIYTALTNLTEVEGQAISVYPSPPQNPAAFIAYIELSNATQGKAFGSLDTIWEITATGSAKQSTPAATAFLDQLTDAIITVIISTGVGNVDDVQPYFVLTDNSSGGTVPATRITITSRTNL
ncbi:hypothetical protein RQN30_02310 [Arcanobacterium hippocoleae]